MAFDLNQKVWAMADARVSPVDCLHLPTCFDLCLYRDQFRTRLAGQWFGSRSVQKAFDYFALIPILRL